MPDWVKSSLHRQEYCSVLDRLCFLFRVPACRKKRSVPSPLSRLSIPPTALSSALIRPDRTGSSRSVRSLRHGRQRKVERSEAAIATCPGFFSLGNYRRSIGCTLEVDAIGGRLFQRRTERPVNSCNLPNIFRPRFSGRNINSTNCRRLYKITVSRWFEARPARFFAPVPGYC